ncbi:MAG: hypothetical protein LUE87_11015 [Lachnospiraceae bacterium]|nr:hypothetical protein [Lachnospiraceae bacterium]
MDLRTERAAVALDGDVGASPHLICSAVKQVTEVTCFLFSYNLKSAPAANRSAPDVPKEMIQSDNQLYCITPFGSAQPELLFCWLLFLYQNSKKEDDYYGN